MQNINSKWKDRYEQVLECCQAQQHYLICTNQQPPQHDVAVPDPLWVGSKWLLAFPRVPDTSSTPSCLFFPPDSLRVLQWNAGGFRARSTELLHFLSSHSVDLICIQESNLYSSSSFRIPGFSALHSDRTHSRSGIFSSDATHASGGVVIFVRQGLSFSELSTSSLSSLDPYSHYVGVNISLNNSSSLSVP